MLLKQKLENLKKKFQSISPSLIYLSLVALRMCSVAVTLALSLGLLE